MNFQETKEQEFVRKMVRDFAENEVEPIAADIDKEHRFPVEMSTFSSVRQLKLTDFSFVMLGLRLGITLGLWLGLSVVVYFVICLKTDIYGCLC